MSRTAEAPPRDGAPSAERPALVVANRPMLIAGVMAAMVMQTLDATIANVALPHMQASLSATQDTISWVLTSYVLASAIALPLVGWLVDTFGTRRMLLISVAAFTAASMLCGIAQDIGQMVLFRVIQGLAGAFLAPLALTVALDSSRPSERARMMGVFTQGVMLGPIAGPIVGGYLTDNFDWRWVFFVNLPVGAICFTLIALSMPRTPTPGRRIDLAGWALVATAIAMLQLMLDRGPSQDWFESGEIVAYAAISAACFWMAAIHLSTAARPLFPRALFADRNFVTGLAFSFVTGFSMMAVMAILPGLLQLIYGYPVVQAGLLLTPRGIAMLAFITLLGKPLARIDPRVQLVFGFGLMAFSLLLMTRWSVVMPTWQIVATGALQGVGLSLMFVPSNLIMFATVPASLRTDASGLSNMVRNLGASIGIATCTFLLARNVQINHAELGERVAMPVVPAPFERLAAFGDASQAVLGMADAMVNRQAAMIAYLDDFLLMSWACLLVIPLVLTIRLKPAR